MVPLVFLAMQILAAVFLVKPNRALNLSATRPTVAVLMPAHNESLVISQAIHSILPQLSEGDKLLVVADNCNDGTADIAKKLGASVIERKNAVERGKGYALDFGLQHLKDNPPEVVLIVDADCIVTVGSIEKLARACAYHHRPIQALYLMESQPNPSLKAKIAAFAWLVKNKVRPMGSLALNMPCQLMGTGMAFCWSDMIQSDLASGHIVEDMKLGVDLTRVNKPPLFMAEALVTSVFPPTTEAANTQRARWEHGHLSVILNEAPSLLFEAIKTKNMQMLGLTLDLIVPPLAVLTLMCVLLLMMSYLFALQPALSITSALVVTLIGVILLAWFNFGRSIISFGQLSYAPIYALIKIPLYIKFFLNRQVEWVRSKRD
jgi:glycosyltransferase involved in cell wall biosynthesis